MLTIDHTYLRTLSLRADDALSICRVPNGPCSYGHSPLFPVSPFLAHKENPSSVLHALARGGVDAVVIAAHGPAQLGLGHYLEPGSDTILTPAVMFASTPGFLARAAAR
jgi:hypothetical protein